MTIKDDIQTILNDPENQAPPYIVDLNGQLMMFWPPDRFEPITDPEEIEQYSRVLEFMADLFVAPLIQNRTVRRPAPGKS